MPTAHRSPPANACALQAERIVVVEVVCSEGEADDCFILDREDAAAKAALFVEGKFERGGDAECVELAAGGVEEGFGFGEFFDVDASRVERRSWLKRAGGGDAEADGVAGDVQAASGEGNDMAVVVGWDAQAKARASRGKDDDAFAPGDAAQKL